MGRAKRIRKLRMRHRRERRLRVSLRQATAFLAEQQERARLRREILASDMPEPVKAVAALLADPVGTLVERALELASKRMKDDESRTE